MKRIVSIRQLRQGPCEAIGESGTHWSVTKLEFDRISEAFAAKHDVFYDRGQLVVRAPSVVGKKYPGSTACPNCTPCKDCGNLVHRDVTVTHQVGCPAWGKVALVVTARMGDTVDFKLLFDEGDDEVLEILDVSAEGFSEYLKRRPMVRVCSDEAEARKYLRTK